MIVVLQKKLLYEDVRTKNKDGLSLMIFGVVTLFFCQGKNITGDVSKQNPTY